MTRCRICSSPKVDEISIRQASFQWCCRCLHAESLGGSPERELVDYYRTKGKWSELYRRYTTGDYKPSIESRYSKRSEYIPAQADKVGIRPAESSLLDVGSAAGFFLSALGDTFASTIGIDPDADAARFATDVLQQNVLAADLQDARIIDRAPFDVVTCFHVLEHVADPVDMVVQMSQLLREGGLLVLSMPVIQTGRKYISFFREFPSDQQPIGLTSEHVHHFSERSARKLASHGPLHELPRRVWRYKGKDYLPEIQLALRRDSRHDPTEIADASAWESWCMRTSLTRWALLSRKPQPKKLAA